MAHRILYSQQTSATGRKLRDILGIRGGQQPGETADDILIRWGSSTRVPRRPRGGVVNGKGAVASAADKLGSLAALSEAHVRVPVVYMPNHVPNDANIFPLLGRRRNHREGTDITLCMQRSDLARVRADFFTKYIPTAREFRVHAFRSSILKVSEKVLTNEEEFQVPWMRNLGNGFTFRHVRDMPRNVRRLIEGASQNATDALGLDFGAVDVLLGDDGEVYILEVNTGPSLGDDTLTRYIHAFANILGIREDRLNWPADMDEGAGPQMPMIPLAELEAMV